MKRKSRKRRRRKRIGGGGERVRGKEVEEEEEEEPTAAAAGAVTQLCNSGNSGSGSNGGVISRSPAHFCRMNRVYPVTTPRSSMSMGFFSPFHASLDVPIPARRDADAGAANADAT